MSRTCLYLLVIILATGCAHSAKDSLHLEAGTWRGVLHRADGAEVPFNFELKDTAGGNVLYVINGSGRLRVDSIRYKGDSVLIHMPFFNSDFRAHLQQDGSLKGLWLKHYPDSDRVLGFSATPHTAYRMTAAPAPPKYNVTGRWRATFGSANDTLGAVGEFHQQGGRVTGTFLTASGDYRYLQGVMDGDTLKLSAFDGSHVFLFTALAESTERLSKGIFYAGFEGRKVWNAYRDTGAHLADAFSLTTHKAGEDKLDFTFPNLEGKPVSVHDDRYKNKVVIVQIMGSWCPNCMDETRFMSNWYHHHRDRGVEVIGLCYERSTDFNEAVKNVMTFKNRFDVTYPLLITGVTPGDPHLLEKTLPQLQHFVGFPTTIFIDKKGAIAKIRAGFSGPGTGAHYQAFIREFNTLVDSLAAE